ncbi:MAG: hypothetical protein IPK13_18285 [Deltaproteobacteria bacterium]|nr:hypothetical protein [Deltaproteobacteria bacterium]
MKVSARQRHAWGCLGLVFLGACTRSSDEGAVRVGVDHALLESGLLQYLETAYSADASAATVPEKIELVVAETPALENLALGGGVDVAIVVSEASRAKLEEAGVSLRQVTFAHEEFVVIGPPLDKDPLGQYARGNAVEFMRSIARSRYRYLKAKVGSVELDRHRWLFAKTNDPREPGSFFASDKEGEAFVEDVNASLALGLVRRSSLLLAAEQGQRPHAVYREGDPDLVLRITAVELHPGRTRRARRPGFFEFLVGEKARGLIDGFGRARFGYPLFGVGEPAEGQGARVPHFDAR